MMLSLGLVGAMNNGAANTFRSTVGDLCRITPGLTTPKVAKRQKKVAQRILAEAFAAGQVAFRVPPIL